MNTRMTVESVWRYPIKSMQGEEISESEITDRGVLGDRAYALVDRSTGLIASAKYPQKWSKLLQCRAVFAEPPRLAQPLPPIRITLPDGTEICSTQPDVDQVLSQVLGRDVTLLAEAPKASTREADRTPIDGSPQPQIIRQEQVAIAAPIGTFFDYAPLHILTTATLQRLQVLYPAGSFGVPRFRPNVVVATHEDQQGFVENGWLDHQLSLGTTAQLQVIDPCPRCVITTLAQGDLPHDLDILRTVGQHNRAASVTLAPGIVLPAVAGVYAKVLHWGKICRGDAVGLA